MTIKEDDLFVPNYGLVHDYWYWIGVNFAPMRMLTKVVDYATVEYSKPPTRTRRKTMKKHFRVDELQLNPHPNPDNHLKHRTE